MLADATEERPHPGQSHPPPPPSPPHRRANRARNDSLTFQQIRLVRDYIQEHLHENILLQELAGSIALSRFHFSRQFRNTTGTTHMNSLLDSGSPTPEHCCAKPDYHCEKSPAHADSRTGVT